MKPVVSPPDALPPGCPHAEQCPGCPLITLPYAAGLERKAERLERALHRHRELGAVAVPPLQAAASITDYRLRAKLVTDRTGKLGLFAAGSHRVVDIPGCKILSPQLQQAAAALRGLLPLEIPLAGVDLRLCDRGVLLCLIADGQVDAEQLERSARQVWEQVPHLVGLAVSVHEPHAVQLLGHELRVLYGEAAERHRLAPEEPWLYASHGAFTQVHAQQARRLHERLERSLAARWGAFTGRRVLELYAGSGVIGLSLAARGAQVSAVESFTPALERLGAAARAQGLSVETHAGNAEDFLRGHAALGGRPLDAVIVNPPRRGLSVAVRRALGELGAQLCVYVSCEPETLARDLAHLRHLGWAAAELMAFDLAPLSEAVESLVVLERQAPPAPQVLFEDEQVLALFQAPFESTTLQGQGGRGLLERAQSALGLPELTPVQRLDPGVSGICWFARRPQFVAPLARALAEGETTYLALAVGVTHPKGKIRRPLRDAGKPQVALTRYRRLAVVGGHSLLELWPEQPSKHQLHRHLASIGHPVLGDERYGRAPANRHFEHRHGLDRPFLHCARVRLELAAGVREIVAELPGDLEAVLTSLRASAAATGRSGAPQVREDHAGRDGDVE
ncbi:MAG TPA: pseudouridine synthase [Polyangiaceae bacterium]|nr:pseudouridine synthase [Polyangiaceae bacterium]